jgi:Fe-S cluster assembly iron-binding protein IscA
MIAITQNAAAAIRQMTNTEVYPEAGLRIAAVDGDRFALRVVPHPAGDDINIDADGANVYLDEQAAEALGQATLDADGSAPGPEQFVLVNA